MAYKFATVVLTIETSELIDTTQKEALLFDDIKDAIEKQTEFVSQVFSVQVTPAIPPRAHHD